MLCDGEKENVVAVYMAQHGSNRITTRRDLRLTTAILSPL